MCVRICVCVCVLHAAVDVQAGAATQRRHTGQLQTHRVSTRLCAHQAGAHFLQELVRHRLQSILRPLLEPVGWGGKGGSRARGCVHRARMPSVRLVQLVPRLCAAWACVRACACTHGCGRTLVHARSSPVDGAAVDNGRVLPQALPERIANGRRAPHHVQVRAALRLRAEVLVLVPTTIIIKW